MQVYTYLPVGAAGDDAPVIGEGHEQRVEHVVLVAGVHLQGRRPLLPVPEHDGAVVGPGQQQAAVAVEAYGVDAPPVLPQPLLYAERVHKVLRSQPASQADTIVRESNSLITAQTTTRR